MVSEEEQVSPEEKLLKVIQGEEDNESGLKPVAPAEEDVSEPEKTGDPVSETSAESSVETAQPVREEGADAGSAGGGLEVGPAFMPGKAKIERSGLSMINGSLAAAVFLIVLLSGWEIWGGIRQFEVTVAGFGATPEPELPDPADDSPVPQGVSADLPYDVEALKSSYDKRPLLMIPERRKRPDRGRTPENEPEKKPKLPDWEKYARQNFKLLGLSRVEKGEIMGIVSEKDKMHYLRKGRELTISGKILTVMEVSRDGVKLSDGEKAITVR